MLIDRYARASLVLMQSCFLSGIITQIMVAGKGVYHEEQFPRVKRPRSKPESREERKQRKYRYLYQVSLFHIHPFHLFDNNEQAAFILYILKIPVKTYRQIKLSHFFFTGAYLSWRCNFPANCEEICPSCG